MARRIQEDDLQAVERVLRRRPDGMTALEISDALESAPPRRTLQYRLRRPRRRTAAWSGMAGGRQNALPCHARRIRQTLAQRAGTPRPACASTSRCRFRRTVPMSWNGFAGRSRSVNRSVTTVHSSMRTAPNETAWLSAAERAQLHEAGRLHTAAEQPAGTHARQVLNRLLIDLSLELEPPRRQHLLAARHPAPARRRRTSGGEAAARSADDPQPQGCHRVPGGRGVGRLQFNRYTILNLHALLAGNLLADPEAEGRLRRIDVGIAGSVFQPLAAPQVVEECFDQMLATAAAIRDPFEQRALRDGAASVLAAVRRREQAGFTARRKHPADQGQPLTAVVSRTCRGGCIPKPCWACTSSIAPSCCATCSSGPANGQPRVYGAIRQSLGEPDPFRMRYRTMLRDVVGAVVRGRMNPRQAADHVGACTRERVEPQDRERFQEVAERELLSLHEGNFARYRIRPSEFAGLAASLERAHVMRANRFLRRVCAHLPGAVR